MITDNNLNDITSEYINKLEKECKRSAKWMYILSVMCLILSACLFINGRNKNILAKDNNILKTQLLEDEQMLSLEYSIGYWFINEPETVNDSILYQFLVDNGAWYPEILLKQAKIESSNYTSNVFNNTCNLYGMKKVGKRQTTQLKSTYNGYGCYTNWCESVLDRMLWDIFMFGNNKPTKEEYLSAMNIYAEAENYVELLNL